MNERSDSSEILNSLEKYNLDISDYQIGRAHV